MHGELNIDLNVFLAFKQHVEKSIGKRSLSLKFLYHYKGKDNLELDVIHNLQIFTILYLKILKHCVDLTVKGVKLRGKCSRL